MIRPVAFLVAVATSFGVFVTAHAVERVPFTAENLAKLPGLPAHLAHPKLGIALSGGGSKASSFAMGVLAGLNDAGVLKDVDVISSVSGGGYAAYFYFSRLLDAATARAGDTGPAAPADWFRHCLTNRAREYFATAGDRIAILSPSAGNSSQSVTRDELMQPRYCPSSLVDVISDQDRKDRYRFQNHVGGFQDFLSPG
ncbi:MAG: patatin-like phospholipase family protein, partial [Tagaea sp.]